VAGVVTAGNAALADTPELINQDPYGAGWILRAKPGDPAALNALMDAAAYAKHLESEAH
jgi:glycine cleavage system H protein